MTDTATITSKSIAMPTQKAKRNSYIYLAFVGALIVVSILVPPPFGSISGMLLGTIGLITGIVVRKVAKRENKLNDTAKGGIWLSLVWILLNGAVFLITTAVILAIGFLASTTSSLFG